MSGWRALDAELQAYAAAGLEPRLWLRDDDATEATAALDRFLDLVAGHHVPPVLAVIPSRATAALAQRLALAPGVWVAQHGYAHVNHAPPGQKKAELGDQRPVRVMLDEIARGRSRLTALFGGRSLPLLVPPWNRIAPDVARSVLGDGLARAVSTFGAALRGSGLAVANTDVDIIDWRGGRRGKPADMVAGEVAAALADARVSGAPVGLLTHHLDHDEVAHEALARLLAATAGKARWLDGREVLAYSVSSRSS
jgi:peptidoglycan/xylan/chitin deacetylase (PgdA/CDA1 family)